MTRQELKQNIARYEWASRWCWSELTQADVAKEFNVSASTINRGIWAFFYRWSGCPPNPRRLEKHMLRAAVAYWEVQRKYFVDSFVEPAQ